MSTRYQELRWDQLVPHTENVRKSQGDVVDLANSIAAQGILQPLTVTPHPDLADMFLIICGHQRREASALANLDILPCIIDPSLDTLEKQLLAMLAENTQRTDLTPVEESAGYQQVFDLGVSVKSLAKAAGRSQSHIRKRLLLNKLSDDAKSKLEDHTLNIDQALVLVDFADDEAATESLLEAATTGRNWSYTVTMETRRRDAPAKIEAATKDLAEANAKSVPDATRYTGGWERIYENDSNAITIQEHVDAGHLYTLSTWGDVEWYKKPAKAPKAPKPELTEEEKEAKQREAALTAALDIAHAVRAEHIKTVIKAPPEGAADEALYRLLIRHLHAHVALFAEITGRHPDTEGGHEGIKAALAAMTVEQMALLLHLAERSQEDELLKLWAWDAGDYRHTWGPKGWIEDLGSVYHYELSSVEQEVLDHFKEAHDAHLAEIAAEDQEEDEDDE